MLHTELTASGRFHSLNHPLYAAGLVLVAQMFCSGRRHTDPSVPWSAGTCCTSGRSTEEMNGVRSFKGHFAGKAPSAL